jgi:nicotinamidase/pyrazinamidase
MKALIVVDAQNDFMPGGSLAITDGDKIIPFINKIVPHYPLVIFTQDWHPKDHCSFKENGGLWPVHCVQNSYGAKLHSGLCLLNYPIIQKGTCSQADSYSAFKDDDGTETTITSLLKHHKILKVDICGLATDYCVKATAIDAFYVGLITTVLLEGCRGVVESTTLKAIHEMVKLGITVK